MATKMYEENKVHIDSYATFATLKLSANSNNNKYYYAETPDTIVDGEPDIKFDALVIIKGTKQVWTHGWLGSLNESPSLPEGLEQNVTDLMNATFPVVALYAAGCNNGTYEVGTQVTPTAVMSIERKGVDVAESAEVVVTKVSGGASGDTATVASNKKSWTATKLSSGSVKYRAEVTQGGQTVGVKSAATDAAAAELTWNFTYYRYRGKLSAVPSNYATAIKGLSTKELSTTSTLDSTALAAGEYYLFAVKGTATLVCRHASTDGIIGGCVTGTATIAQENGKGNNAYSYILVPASKSAWNFKITNS